jgi:hypothetical protein
MPTEFDFEVSDRLKKQFPELCHKYHAEEIDKDTYKITWIDAEDPQPFAYYDKDDIEWKINNNHWIILN